jgi:hypothetical protein
LATRNTQLLATRNAELLATRNAELLIVSARAETIKKEICRKFSGFMNAYAKKLMTYHTVQQLSREGFSVSAICKHLVMDWLTVRKYLSMSEVEYEQFLSKLSERKRELDRFDK